MVNKEGCFVTQRQCPTMALISPRLEISEIGEAEEVILHLSAPGMSDISVKEPPADTPSEQVRYCMDIQYSMDILHSVPSHDSSMAGNPMYTHVIGA